jgi:hypothetical protein
MPANTYLNKNSCGKEYSLIHIGACTKYFISGLNLSIQNLNKSPANLKKYGPPSKM